MPFFPVMAENNSERKSSSVGDIIPVDRTALNLMINLLLENLRQASIHTHATEDNYMEIIGESLSKTQKFIFLSEVAARAIRNKLWESDYANRIESEQLDVTPLHDATDENTKIQSEQDVAPVAQPLNDNDQHKRNANDFTNYANAKKSKNAQC